MNRTRVLLLSGLVLAVIVGVSVYLRQRPPEDGRSDPKRTAADPRDKARELLEDRRDLATCRAALQQATAHLARSGEPPQLSEDRRAALAKAGLKPDELAELDSTAFTLLDGHHLDLCFLLRDAALSLELRAGKPQQGEPGTAVTAQEEAEAAFAWVVRQVGLVPPPDDAEARRSWGTPAEEIVSPQFALRLGLGSPLTRSVLFLTLLRQLGHDGCLLATPGPERRYWACGVLSQGGKDVYLFDPRMGMPLPSADGKGVATLAEVRQKNSPALARLNFDKDNPYDVTPEEAAASEVYLAPSLSALAPRMAWLESEVLAPTVKVRLAVDPEVQAARFARALGVKPEEVRLADWAVRLARNFYPESEGGVDKTQRQQAVTRGLMRPYMLALVAATPPDIHPRDEREWIEDQPLGRLTYRFMKPIVDFHQAPDQPRERMLRGQLRDALSELGTLREGLLAAQRSFEINYRPAEIEKWFEAAVKVGGNLNDPAVQARAQEIDRLHGKQLVVLAEGAAAPQRLSLVSYYSALCQHELAERAHFHFDHPLGAANDDDFTAARNAWKTTLSQWDRFRLDHGQGPALLLQARAYQMLARLVQRRADQGRAGDPGLQQDARGYWQTAQQAWLDAAHEWKDVPLTALACRYQARRIEDRLRSAP